MIRTTSPRSAYITATKRRPRERPSKTKRCSPAEWRGSDTIQPNGSPNTVAASSKETWCLARFDVAFCCPTQTPTTTLIIPALRNHVRSSSEVRSFYKTVVARFVLAVENPCRILEAIRNLFITRQFSGVFLPTVFPQNRPHPISLILQSIQIAGEAVFSTLRSVQ